MQTYFFLTAQFGYSIKSFQISSTKISIQSNIVEMEAVGFSKPSGMEAASMVKSAQKVNGSNESKA